jgi:predicted AlkP superfamily phosphohydrolase/phosphomutase
MSRNAEMGRRVLVLGLDGGSWQVLDRFMEAGRMPNLARLARSGYRGVLESTVPPITPVAWASFATGMNPGRHGVFSFLASQLEPGGYVPPPTRRDVLQAPTLWRRLSDAGLRTTVLSVPLTYPPEPVNGFLVSGMFTPGLESRCTYPAGLKKELVALDSMPKFQLDFTGERLKGRAEERLGEALANGALKYFADVTDVTERLRRASLHLMEKPWDLFVAVFIGPDRIQHVLWDEVVAAPAESEIGRRIFDYYGRLDEVIGELVAAAGDDAVTIMMSDHGFGPCAGQYSLGRWLVDEGFAASGRSHVYRAARWFLDRTGLKAAAGRAIKGKNLDRIARNNSAHTSWKRTRAYFPSGTYGLRVNLRGREREGIVKPGAEFEELRRELRDRVLEIEDPATGKPVISAAWLTEEVYEGPHSGWAPDVLLGPNPELGYHLVHGNVQNAERVREDRKTKGSHRPDGILLVSGHGVVACADAPRAGIADLAPTVLWLLGLEVPDEMDGRAIAGAFTGTPASRDLATRAAETDDAPRERSEDEEELVRAHLRDLGYLD